MIINLKSEGFISFYAFLMVIVFGYIDLISGFETSLSIFYMIPVFYASSNAGLKSGLFISVACTISWFYSDMLAGSNYSQAWIPYWNALVHLGFFIIFSFAFVRLKATILHEKQLARTDSLTKLSNSRHFMEILDMEIKKSSRYQTSFTLCYIDVDNFKDINDSMGHNAGDRLLQLISAIITHNIRSTDTAARIGGDEFAILFSQLEKESVSKIISKLNTHLSEGVRLQDFNVTVSMGCATFQFALFSAEESIKLADNLMYTAKRSGKNRIEFRNY